jgi:hypothetical protein
MIRRRSAVAWSIGAALSAGACTHAPPAEIAPDITTRITEARVAPGDEPVAPGDCVEALRRALDKPDLAVDRIPSPIVARPAALIGPPRSALRKDGSADVKVDVLIDTLGKADMRTFKIVSASSEWLVKNVKSVIGKWTFAPAELAGCKVPRLFHFMASAPPRKRTTH